MVILYEVSILDVFGRRKLRDVVTAKSAKEAKLKFLKGRIRVKRIRTQTTPLALRRRLKRKKR